MATIEEAVYSRLTDDGAVAAQVGTRVYPLVIPQDVDLPAIAYQVISSEAKWSHSGPSGLTQTRVQLTIVADDYATAKATDQAVRAAFNAVSFDAAGVHVQGAFIDNVLDDFDAAVATPTIRTDVIVWHEAA